MIFFLVIKSRIRPAVPTIIWGLSRSFLIWWSILTSPMIGQDWIFKLLFLASTVICSWICITSSWVGAKIMACISRFVKSIFSKRGRTNAKVLPLPVCDSMMTSWPSRKAGKVSSWIGIGEVIPWCFSPSMREWFIFNALKVCVIVISFAYGI